MVISVFQRYKTDLSISIGWYINIRSVKEITVFSYKFELKPYNLKCYYRIFYGRITATTAADFFTIHFADFVFTVYFI